MAPLDWVFLAVLALSMALGAWRGLVYEVLSVAGWVAAFVLAQWLAPDMAAWLPMGQSTSEVLRYAAGFVVVFVGALFAAGLLAWLAKKVIEAVGLRPVDRVLGAAFGLVRGVVIALAATVVVQMTPLKDTAAWNESAGAGIASRLLKGLKPILPERFGQYLPG
ncbi:CvpA family protein [Ramlibacter sp. MAHUQ-53]|uniref:CvpA family protein n=1 Tax=unclassified Ramlibacter TaxID=2617605 RepID=UPI0036389177